MSLVDTAWLDDLGRVAGSTGVGLLAAAPLARGLLGGPYDLERPPPTGHVLLSRKGLGYWNDNGRAVAARVRRVAAERGLTAARTALSAVLDHPGVSAVVVGARSPAQLAECTAVRPGLLDRPTVEYLRGAPTANQHDTTPTKERVP